jgi:signal transduction histidine kinase
VEFSRAELSIERVSLNGLIERSVELVKGQNRFNGVTWDVRLAESLPELLADAGQLQQVFLNLFLNAADAMNEAQSQRKQIRVTGTWDERQRAVRIAVSDTGPGVALENRARIFEPSFTTKKGGHGFGLSTSYRIITNHGGRIAVECPPGEGATFLITLPQDRAGSTA